jgi:single-strand DNA-binding protein
MGKGINRATILGNCGADPDVRYTAGGAAVTTIRVATSETWKDKETGEQQERTEWHRIKFFGRLAEIAGEYLKKGRQVYVEGRIQTDKYTDKDGVERYSTEIVGQELQMLGSGRDDGGHEGSGARSGGQSSQRGPQRTAGAGQGTRSQTGGSRQGVARPPVPAGEYIDEEVPF